MKRGKTVVVAVAVLAVTLSSVPVQNGPTTVEAKSKLTLPELDWFYEGKNLRYRITNGSSTLTLNVTIADKSGTQAKFNYWTTSNGSKKWLQTRYQDKNRSDLNFTDFYTYLWVNQTNIETTDIGEVLQIGDSNYEMVAITTEHYVFQNETRTYKYDKTKGWLAEASYPDGVDVKLVDDTDGVPELDHGNVCETLEDNDDEKTRRCTALTTYAWAAIDDIGSCDAKLTGVVRALWPGWHLFDYGWKMSLEGQNNGGSINSDSGALLEDKDRMRDNVVRDAPSCDADAYVEIYNQGFPHPDTAFVDISLQLD